MSYGLDDACGTAYADHTYDELLDSPLHVSGQSQPPPPPTTTTHLDEEYYEEGTTTSEDVTRYLSNYEETDQLAMDCDPMAQQRNDGGCTAQDFVARGETDNIYQRTDLERINRIVPSEAELNLMEQRLEQVEKNVNCLYSQDSISDKEKTSTTTHTEAQQEVCDENDFSSMNHFMGGGEIEKIRNSFSHKPDTEKEIQRETGSTSEMTIMEEEEIIVPDKDQKMEEVVEKNKGEESVTERMHSVDAISSDESSSCSIRVSNGEEDFPQSVEEEEDEDEEEDPVHVTIEDGSEEDDNWDNTDEDEVEDIEEGELEEGELEGEDLEGEDIENEEKRKRDEEEESDSENDDSEGESEDLSIEEFKHFISTWCIDPEEFTGCTAAFRDFNSVSKFFSNARDTFKDNMIVTKNNRLVLQEQTIGNNIFVGLLILYLQNASSILRWREYYPKGCNLLEHAMKSLKFDELNQYQQNKLKRQKAENGNTSPITDIPRFTRLMSPSINKRLEMIQKYTEGIRKEHMEILDKYRSILDPESDFYNFLGKIPECRGVFLMKSRIQEEDIKKQDKNNPLRCMVSGEPLDVGDNIYIISLALKERGLFAIFNAALGQEFYDTNEKLSQLKEPSLGWSCALVLPIIFLFCYEAKIYHQLINWRTNHPNIMENNEEIPFSERMKILFEDGSMFPKIAMNYNQLRKCVLTISKND